MALRIVGGREAPRSPIERALKQGTLIKIKYSGCVSGVPGNDPLFQRMMAATEDGYDWLAGQERLRTVLEKSYREQGKIAQKEVARQQDACFYTYTSPTGEYFGCHLPTEEDNALYQRGAFLAANTVEEGPQRRILLKLLDISAPPEIETMSSQSYAAILNKMADFSPPATISFSSTCITITGANGDTLSIPRARLCRDGSFFRLELADLAETRILPESKSLLREIYEVWRRLFGG